MKNVKTLPRNFPVTIPNGSTFQTNKFMVTGVDADSEKVVTVKLYGDINVFLADDVPVRDLTIVDDISERGQFEAYILTGRGTHYLTRNAPKVDPNEEYADSWVQEAWEAWQARGRVI
jgi:hypothetical protein